MAPDYYDYSVRKSGKIGAQRAALIYREPLKEGYSSGSLVINEVVLEGVFSEIRRPATQEDRPHGRCPFPYKGRRMSLLPYSDQAGRIFPPPAQPQPGPSLISLFTQRPRRRRDLLRLLCSQGLWEVRFLSSETLLLWSLRATRSTASLLAAHTPKRAAAVPSGRLSIQEAASEVSNR